MTEKTNVYPAGTVIAFSEGEYSDYGYVDHLVTRKQCDIAQLISDYKAGYVAKNEYDSAAAGGFVAWLVVEGHCFPADVTEIHIGSYGRLEL